MRPTRGRPPTPENPGPRRAVRTPKLIDRIVDYPYGRLFGLKGQLVIAAVVLVGLAVKFVTGIATVTVDPTTCELAWSDRVYTVFHKQRIIANSERELNRLTGEKQTILWAIKAGRDPFPSKSDGNVAKIRRIDNDKFFWRAYATNLEKELAAMVDCRRKLETVGLG